MGSGHAPSVFASDTATSLFASGAPDANVAVPDRTTSRPGPYQAWSALTPTSRLGSSKGLTTTSVDATSPPLLHENVQVPRGARASSGKLVLDTPHSLVRPTSSQTTSPVGDTIRQVPGRSASGRLSVAARATARRCTSSPGRTNGRSGSTWRSAEVYSGSSASTLAVPNQVSAVARSR
jgi:hypothetical protein